MWARDLDSHRPKTVMAAVDAEASGVRCRKILAYLHGHNVDVSSSRTIEVGCGGAVYSMILARLGAHPTLLDYSSDALLLAESNLGALNLNGEFVQADAFNILPEYLGQYDIAMSFGTVEHYRYPPRLKICQAHVDLVRPGGLVIISVPNILFLPHEILKLLLIARRKWFLGYEGSLSRGELQRVGRRLGLLDLRIAGSSWLSDVRRYKHIVRDTQTFQRWFCAGKSAKESDVNRKPEAHQWLDDYLGHDIVLLGMKPK